MNPIYSLQVLFLAYHWSVCASNECQCGLVDNIKQCSCFRGVMMLLFIILLALGIWTIICWTCSSFDGIMSICIRQARLLPQNTVSYFCRNSYDKDLDSYFFSSFWSPNCYSEWIRHKIFSWNQRLNIWFSNRSCGSVLMFHFRCLMLVML